MRFRLTQQMLDALLTEHRLWQTDRDQGERLILRTADCSGLSFDNSDLRGAVFVDVWFNRATFRGAIL